MAKQFVFSTLSTNMKYVEWAKAPADAKDFVPTEKRSVVIKGGAGVAQKNFLTPLGVATEVDDEDISVLQQDPVFKAHERNGFMRIEKRNQPVEKVVSSMEGQDGSAPITESDYGPNGRFKGIDAPTVGQRGIITGEK